MSNTNQKRTSVDTIQMNADSNSLVLNSHENVLGIWYYHYITELDDHEVMAQFGMWLSVWHYSFGHGVKKRQENRVLSYFMCVHLCQLFIVYGKLMIFKASRLNSLIFGSLSTILLRLIINAQMFCINHMHISILIGNRYCFILSRFKFVRWYKITCINNNEADWFYSQIIVFQSSICNQIKTNIKIQFWIMFVVQYKWAGSKLLKYLY